MTGKRGGWDAMLPLVEALEGDSSISLDVLVTDQHLSHDFGYTYDQVRKDCKNPISILSHQSGDSIRGRTNAGADMLRGFAAYLESHKPDLALVYGDRLEALMWATACVMFNIPVGHMQSGDHTGGVDNIFRRCIEDTASLHFCSLGSHALFLIQRTKNSKPKEIHIVGDQHIDRIIAGDITSDEELVSKYSPLENLVIVLYHPDTLSRANTQDEIRGISEALRESSESNIIQIMGCSDQFYRDADRLDVTCRSFTNIPSRDFLGLLKKAKFIIGNSSCGIIEAPYLNTPAIDIGDRQNGRITASFPWYQNSDADINLISGSLKYLTDPKLEPSKLYGDGTANAQIYAHIKKWSGGLR